MELSVRFEMRLSPEMKAEFERAAAADGLRLAEWLRCAGLACVRKASYNDSARSQGVEVESGECKTPLPSTPTSSQDPQP